LLISQLSRQKHNALLYKTKENMHVFISVLADAQNDARKQNSKVMHMIREGPVKASIEVFWILTSFSIKDRFQILTRDLEIIFTSASSNVLFENMHLCY